MKTKKLALNDKQFHSWKLEPETPKDNLAVVTLHGAGASDSTRALPLALEFEAAGIPAVSLDFFGHGKTGGKLSETSIAERIEQTKAAIDFWLEKDSALILCGFSLSGHVALRLSQELDGRVVSLGLFCPAVYAKEAETVSFGPDFRRIIHQEDSWRRSPAIQAAAQFKGKALLCIGEADEVIPIEVITVLAEKLHASAAQFEKQIIPGVDHQLARWLATKPDKMKQIVNYLTML